MKQLKKLGRLNRQLFVIIPILLAAYALRVYQIDQQSIWWDEGHSIFVAQHPLTSIPTLPAMDVHPPAYFMLLHGWISLAGRSEFALRYLSLIFGLLTIALLGRFAQEPPHRKADRSFNKNQLWIAMIITMTLAALSPLYVAYSQEVRSYSMVTCLALGSTLLLWQRLTSSPSTRYAKNNQLSRSKRTSIKARYGTVVGYILLTTASLYTHYFTLFLLLFHNLVWLLSAISLDSLWKGKTSPDGRLSRSKSTAASSVSGTDAHHQTEGFKQPLFDWLTAQATILILFLPQLRLATRQITDYANPNLRPPTLSYFLYHSWQSYTIGMAVEPAIVPLSLSIIAGLLLISLAILATRHISLTLFLLGWLILPLTFYFLVLQSRPSFEPRYLMLITPAIFLILGGGLSRQSPHLTGNIRLMQPLIMGILLLPIVGLFTNSLHRYYTDTAYFKDDSAGVITWLTAESTAADIILVDVPHPFHYYTNRISAPIEYLFVDVHTAAETLTEKSHGHGRLFWITWRGSDTDPRQVIPFLARKQGKLLGQREFRGYHVRWFSLTGQPFSLPNQLEPISATFGDLLRLDGAAYGQVNGHVWVTLQFNLLRETETNYKVSARLRHDDGSIIAQDDRDLLNDRHLRTAAWSLTDPTLNQAINVYWLTPSPVLSASGGYQLEVVVYDAEPPYPSEGVTGANSSAGGAALIGRLGD